MYTFWLLVSYIMVLLIIFFMIKNIFLSFSGGKFLMKLVMAGLYVLAIIIAFDASKFAHMASLYPNQYTAAGLSSKEIVIRNMASIAFIIAASFIKRSIDRTVDEKVKENQNDQRTQKWSDFFKK